MIPKVVRSAFLVLIIAFSCAEDDSPTESTQLTNEEETQSITLVLDPDFQYCDSVFIATYSGTACCVSGPTAAKPGETFKYHYQMNHKDAQVYWQIFEGDISIIAGQDTHTITVQFDPGFTTGIIIADGYGIKSDDIPRQRCSDRVVVTRKPD